MSGKVIIHALSPPLPEQILPSQKVSDWLNPRGRDMRSMSPGQVQQNVAQQLASRMGNSSIESRILAWLQLWGKVRTTPHRGEPRNAGLVALQLEAHHVFQGGDIDHLGADAERDDVKLIRRAEGLFLQELLIQMYRESQEQLARREIEAITLWRGEKGIFSPDQESLVDIGELPFQPLNSFSHQLKQAFRFSGHHEGALIVVSAPASRILASPATGFGVLQQKEEVLFAIPNTVNLSDEGIVTQWSDVEDWQYFSTLEEQDWVELLQDFYTVRLEQEVQDKGEGDK